MSILEQAKQAHGARTIELEVPEWTPEGAEVVKVTFRRLTAPDYVQLNTEFPGELSGIQVYQYMLRLQQLTAINEDGSPLLDDDHLYLLSDYPALVTRLGKQLIQFNGMGGRLKNFESSQ